MHGLKEACGVVGIYAPGRDVARMAHFALMQLQHRGEESAGIAVSNGEKVKCHRGMGLVMQVFDQDALSLLGGEIAIGHNRYSTTGSTRIANAQPVLVPVPAVRRTLAFAHNGNLVNAALLRERLQASGIHLETTADSEAMAKLIALQADRTAGLEEAIAEAAGQAQGAYSVVMMTEDRLMALRDPHGVRPLCLGELAPGQYVVASESCVMPVLGARWLREVSPGELITIDTQGLHSEQVLPPAQLALCVFEFIYFARPDSMIAGVLLHQARRRMGAELAREHPVEADLVVPVPETGWPAAIGYAEVSGVPLGQGLIRNRYIGRTFIQPDQRMRELGAQIKYTAMPGELQGKRVIAVDDTIVRGTTKAQTVRLLRDAGACEVHVRITAPRYRYPCFYGVDTSARGQLIAARLGSVEEIRQAIGADSLGYQTMSALVRAIGLPADTVCMACLDNKYPIPVPDEMQATKFALEKSPDSLVDVGG
ncbi:amidophosphoribosyltransferase [candidate division KD3-62 bacterium DG_56]|uniref:Amidophosphoribosyltransferase n=1 Tax=candidate division KD3-62 bacterium DG_56 TaxID=1704032 RepID=A0A0S7XNF7_9BACT|nr:MAG: amidophosphoribosyltransferase [candidate division KD3-62 bacterium DG_56]